MRSSDRGELRFRPCSCASFLLAQKGAGFLSCTLKETKGDLAFKPISEIFFLLSAKGRGFSFLHLERNKKGCLAFKRISEIFFLLSAKGSENAQGEFSEFPPGNPKTPHTPTNEKQARREHSPPYLRGQKGNINKRTSPIWKTHQKKRWRQ